MAKIIVSSRFIKNPSAQNAGKLVKYMGTREGVEKVLKGRDGKIATQQQFTLINRITKHFPDTKKYIEFDDFMMKPSKANATEFINAVAEREADRTDKLKSLVSYIAERPGVEKLVSHGLFSATDEAIDLDDVADKVSAHEGVVWTHVISLRREDAERLGYNNADTWKQCVRRNMNELAEAHKLKPSDMEWYAAFHNTTHHPHIHLIVYDKENHGYLDNEGIENIKSTFAHVIFQDEMLNIQNEKSDRRDKLRLRGKDEIEEIICRINNGSENNFILQAMLIDLSRRLKEHKGKKTYGYLSKNDKYIVDRIVDQIEKIPAVKELYDLWYEKQEELRRIYSETIPNRVPLSENPEFKSIRNAVIHAAAELDIKNARLISPSDDEYDIVGIEIPDEKINQTRQNYSDKKQDCASCPSESTPNNQHIACYRPVNSSYMATTVSRLLNHVSRVFRDKFSDNPDPEPKTDIKLWKKILEKDEAHGIKHG